MTLQTLERRLKTFEEPLSNSLLKWLYIHIPPQPLTNKKMHQDYAQSVSVLMEELEMGEFQGQDKEAVEKHLNAVIHFIDDYEKKRFPSKDVTPEEMLKFLMEQHSLTQSDLADILGGQSAVSYVINGKRKLTREQISKLSRHFHVSEATFYPSVMQ